MGEQWLVGYGRQSVKARPGRTAVQDLRSRCLARVRNDRERLLNRLRSLTSDASDVPKLESVRDALRREVSLVVSNERRGQVEDDWDEDALLAIEESILRDLEEEAVERATCEMEELQEWQNVADSALFDQHLLGGVPCPLCGLGRIAAGDGEVRCDSCVAMRVVVMDETMSIETVAEMLGQAEDQHRWSGCDKRARFEVASHLGPTLLHLSCGTCGWREVVF